MHQGFFRIACASPEVRVADTRANADNIIALIDQAYKAGAEAVVFPEMCVTAYTCADLFHQQALLDGSREALRLIAAATASRRGMLVAVGAPVCHGSSLYNCAVLLADGMPLCAVAKTYIPGYN